MAIMYVQRKSNQLLQEREHSIQINECFNRDYIVTIPAERQINTPLSCLLIGSYILISINFYSSHFSPRHVRFNIALKRQKIKINNNTYNATTLTQKYTNVGPMYHVFWVVARPIH